ncbi:hypothetical protein ACFE04_031254 [Oxalis oulophora]
MSTEGLVPCGFLLVGLFFVSESPRWLYNRIYSPATFGKKYDPNGNYIRHFLPILKVVFHDSASKECKSKMGEDYELNRRLSGQVSDEDLRDLRRKLEDDPGEVSQLPISIV